MPNIIETAITSTIWFGVCFNLENTLLKLKASLFFCLSVNTSAVWVDIERLYLEHISNVLVFAERNVIYESTGYSDKEIFIYPENFSVADMLQRISSNHDLHVVLVQDCKLLKREL